MRGKGAAHVQVKHTADLLVDGLFHMNWNALLPAKTWNILCQLLEGLNNRWFHGWLISETGHPFGELHGPMDPFDLLSIDSTARSTLRRLRSIRRVQV
jgi:hypothetical protein